MFTNLVQCSSNRRSFESEWRGRSVWSCWMKDSRHLVCKFSHVLIHQHCRCRRVSTIVLLLANDCVSPFIGIRDWTKKWRMKLVIESIRLVRWRVSMANEFSSESVNCWRRQVKHTNWPSTHIKISKERPNTLRIVVDDRRYSTCPMLNESNDPLKNRRRTMKNIFLGVFNETRNVRQGKSLFIGSRCIQNERKNEKISSEMFTDGIVVETKEWNSSVKSRRKCVDAVGSAWSHWINKSRQERGANLVQTSSLSFSSRRKTSNGKDFVTKVMRSNISKDENSSLNDWWRILSSFPTFHFDLWRTERWFNV